MSVNVAGRLVYVISVVMKIDKGDIELRSKLDEDLDMDDSDIEYVLEKMEDMLHVELIDFYDASEVKTVGQLSRFIKQQLEM